MSTLDPHHRPAHPLHVGLCWALALLVTGLRCLSGCTVEDPCEASESAGMRSTILVSTLAAAGCFGPTGTDTDPTTATSTSTSTSPSTSTGSTTPAEPTTTTAPGSSSSTGESTITSTTAAGTTGSTSMTTEDVSSTTSTGTSSSGSSSTGPDACTEAFGPVHEFIGKTSTVFVTERCCSPSDCDFPDHDYDAAFFCRGFYGPDCVPLPGYEQGFVGADQYGMTRGNECGLSTPIPGTECHPGKECGIRADWGSPRLGLTKLICSCPCEETG